MTAPSQKKKNLQNLCNSMARSLPLPVRLKAWGGKMFKLEAYLIKMLRMLRNRFKLEAHVLTNMPLMSNVQTWRPTCCVTEDAVQVEGSKNLNYIFRSRCWYKMFKLEVYTSIKIVSISILRHSVYVSVYYWRWWSLSFKLRCIGRRCFRCRCSPSMVEAKVAPDFLPVCISPFFLHISQVMSWKGSRCAVDSTNFWKKIHKYIAR